MTVTRAAVLPALPVRWVQVLVVWAALMPILGVTLFMAGGLVAPRVSDFASGALYVVSAVAAVVVLFTRSRHAAAIMTSSGCAALIGRAIANAVAHPKVWEAGTIAPWTYRFALVLLMAHWCWIVGRRVVEVCVVVGAKR